MCILCALEIFFRAYRVLRTLTPNSSPIKGEGLFSKLCGQGSMDVVWWGEWMVAGCAASIISLELWHVQRVTLAQKLNVFRL